MSDTNPGGRFTAAVGQRFDHRHLLSGRVQPESIELDFPDIPRIPSTGAPNPIFSRLAKEHPWDIGEQAFSTYLLAHDLGKPWVALPVFPSRFFPHTGLWVNAQSAIRSVGDLVENRVACGSFAANYAVWCRGALTHQYDVPIQKMTWVATVDEHLEEFRPPRRFELERLPGHSEAVDLLAAGTVEAATLPGPARGADPTRVRPLFDEPYLEIAAYVEQNGFFPINTVITMRRDSVERNPDLPRLLFGACQRAKALYDAEIAEGREDLHMGLSLRRLNEVAGLALPDYGFAANRACIATMIAHCYEQGVINRLVDPEDLFVLTGS